MATNVTNATSNWSPMGADTKGLGGYYSATTAGAPIKNINLTATVEGAFSEGWFSKDLGLGGFGRFSAGDNFFVGPVIGLQYGLAGSDKAALYNIIGVKRGIDGQINALQMLEADQAGAKPFELTKIVDQPFVRQV